MSNHFNYLQVATRKQSVRLYILKLLPNLLLSVILSCLFFALVLKRVIILSYVANEITFEPSDEEITCITEYCIALISTEPPKGLWRYIQTLVSAKTQTQNIAHFHHSLSILVEWRIYRFTH